MTSTLSPKVRTFVVLIDVEGSHPNLMPDLTASLDVELTREPGALVVPRDAVRFDGEQAFVRVQRGSGFADQPVTLGAMNAHEVVVDRRPGRRRGRRAQRRQCAARRLR